MRYNKISFSAINKHCKSAAKVNIAKMVTLMYMLKCIIGSMLKPFFHVDGEYKNFRKLQNKKLPASTAVNPFSTYTCACT